MDRRTFLKTLVSLGAVIAIPPDLTIASVEDVDRAWKQAQEVWGLFEVDDFGTLSYANFEEPGTRRDAYGYLGASDFDVAEIERRWSLNERIKDRYREILTNTAESDPRIEVIDYNAIDERVEVSWDNWYENADTPDREAIVAVIEAWLDEAPDWCQEWDELYKSGTGQGAAYDHFQREDPQIMDALGVLLIEGECPGSSYFAARLLMPITEANAIAEAHGWEIRFVAKGQGDVA